MKTMIGFLVWLVLRAYTLVARVKSVTFYTPQGEPYLTRWPLWTRERFPDAQGRTGGEGWFLHLLSRSDYERTLHNHPAASVAFPLRVGYIEERYEYDPEHNPVSRIIQHRSYHRAPGSINVLTHASFHRVELLTDGAVRPRPAWSLFYIAPRHGRGWGFLQPDGTVKRAAHNDGNTGERTERNETVRV